MATRKTPTKKPAAKKPATKRATPKAKPTATDKAVSAPVEAPEAAEATTTPADTPKPASVDDAPTTGLSVATGEGATVQAQSEASLVSSAPEPDKTTASPTEDDADLAVSVIKRVYRGTTFELHPQADGTFKLGEETFKSMTAAAQHVTGATKGISGPRFWLGSSASGRSGSRLTPEQRAARAAQKAAEKARKAEAKASALRAAEVAALGELIAVILKAQESGRLTAEQKATLQAGVE